MNGTMSFFKIENCDVDPVRVAEILKSKKKIFPKSENLCPSVDETHSMQPLELFIFYQLHHAIYQAWYCFRRDANFLRKNKTSDTHLPICFADLLIVERAVTIILQSYEDMGPPVIKWMDAPVRELSQVYVFQNGVIYDMKVVQSVIGSMAIEQIRKHYNFRQIPKKIHAETQTIIFEEPDYESICLHCGDYIDMFADHGCVAEYDPWADDGPTINAKPLNNQVESFCECDDQLKISSQNSSYVYFGAICFIMTMILYFENQLPTSTFHFFD